MRKYKDFQGTVYIHTGCKNCEIQCCKKLYMGIVRTACYNLTGSTHWRQSMPSIIKLSFKHFIVYGIPHYKEELKRAIRKIGGGK